MDNGDQEMTRERIEDLLGRLRTGDRAAREEMFLYLIEQFRALARRMLRTDFPKLGQHAETDDILHDLVLKLLPYFENSDPNRGFDGVAKFNALVATALRHTLIDLARKIPARSVSLSEDDGLAGSHPMLRMSSGLKGWRDRHRVHEMVERLPAPERAVMELSIYLNFGTGRIAEMLGVHPGTVSKQLASAKEMLGRMIKADDRVGA